MNLNSLGVNYTVLDYDSGSVKEITVVDSKDLYKLTQQFSGREHMGGTIRKQLPNLEGITDDISFVAWYSAPESEFQLEKAILYARSLDTTLVVIEILEDDK